MMYALLFVTIIRVVIYLFAAYVAYSYKNYLVMLLGILAALIATLTFFIESKLTIGILNDIFSVVLLIVAYNTKAKE